MVKVRLGYDENGYIDGWGTDYEGEDHIELSREELATIVFGYSKLVDGHIVTDPFEPPEEPEAPPSFDDLLAENAELKSRIDMAEGALLDLADMMLSR